MTRVTIARCVGRLVLGMIGRSIIATLLLVAANIPLLAQTKLTVAAAADLGSVLREIAADFEKRSGTHIALVFGSSGNLTTQIENGAPYDVFLSADTDYPSRLDKEGLTLSGITPYAIGKLVLWIPRFAPSDVRRMGMDALLAPAIRKVALANPEHAPYGRAALAAMKHFGIYEKVQSKLVVGENVGQAAQFVLSGNADAGLVAMSVVSAHGMPGQGSVYALPPGSYPLMTQAAVILKQAREREKAKAFLDYLKGDSAMEIFKRHGFLVPGPAGLAGGSGAARP